MNREIVFFRFALLIALVGLLPCSLYSAYCFYQIGEWQELVKSSYNHLSECRVDDYCDPVSWKELFDSNVAGRDLYTERAHFFAQLSWLIPATSMFSFYAIRWALLGRIKPVWPREF